MNKMDKFVIRYNNTQFKDNIAEKLNTYDLSLPLDRERVEETWMQDGYLWRITKRIWNWREDEAKDSIELYISACKSPLNCKSDFKEAYVYLADAPTKYKMLGLRSYKKTKYDIQLI